MEREQIQTFDEYDEKYSIHYYCKTWADELCRLLQENQDIEKYEKVVGFISERGR